MLVIGNAADAELRWSVSFWKDKGLAIDFLPYRIFKLGEKTYFEFFSKPYDFHANPSDCKGVIFDTNRSYDDEEHGCFKEMLQKNRVAAYGDRKEAVTVLGKGDTVFYSHRWEGIVAAAEVIGRTYEKEGDSELFWKVRFLTKPPTDFNSIPKLRFKEVRRLLGKNFYWARIAKVPYLSREESELLLSELKKVTGPNDSDP